jgi:hypothetical protein
LSKIFDRIENDSIRDSRAFHEKRLPRFPDDRLWFGNGSTGFRVEWGTGKAIEWHEDLNTNHLLQAP